MTYGPGWEIITMDGGNDRLLPHRWKAFCDNISSSLEGGGLTEKEAVEDYKGILAREYPNILWWQSLPVKRIT